MIYRWWDASQNNDASSQSSSRRRRRRTNSNTFPTERGGGGEQTWSRRRSHALKRKKRRDLASVPMPMYSGDIEDEGLEVIGPAPPTMGASFVRDKNKDAHHTHGRRLTNIAALTYRVTFDVPAGDKQEQERGNNAILKAQGLAENDAMARNSMNQAMGRAFSLSVSYFDTWATPVEISTIDTITPTPSPGSPSSGGGTGGGDSGSDGGDGSGSSSSTSQGGITSAFQTFVGVSLGIVCVTAALCLAACCMDVMARFMATNAFENARNRLVPLSYLSQEIPAYRYSETKTIKGGSDGEGDDSDLAKGGGDDDEDEEHSCCICLCEFEQDELVRVRELMMRI